MKKEQSELEARGILRSFAEPMVLDYFPTNDREKIMLKMAWHNGKTHKEIAKHFSLTANRVRTILLKELYKVMRALRDLNDERELVIHLKKENAALKNSVTAFQKRFESLKKKKELPKNSTEKTKEDFGDLKVLKITTEELKLDNATTWLLLRRGITNIACLLDYTEDDLRKRKLNSKQIESVKRALAKYKLSLSKK